MPHPLPGSPMVSCQAFCKEKPLGEKTERTKKINFHWPPGEPRVFARMWRLVAVCGGGLLGRGVGPGPCGRRAAGVFPWAVPSCLSKALDPLPEARRAACLCFCGGPHGPQQAPAGKGAGRQAALSEHLVSSGTRTGTPDAKLGSSWGPRHCPTGPGPRALHPSGSTPSPGHWVQASCFCPFGQ